MNSAPGIMQHDQEMADITFTDSVTHACPFPAYDRLREEAPVYLDPVTGHYVLTRYADIRSALMKFKQYSNAVGLVGLRESDVAAEVEAMYQREGWPQNQQMQSMDPPGHREKRSRVDRAFARWNVEKIEPLIGALANELVDDFVDQGTTEFVASFAAMLSISVITQQLGVVREPGSSINDYVGQIQQWSDLAIEEIDPMLPPERYIEITREMIAMQHFFVNNIQRVAAAPDDTLLSQLVQSVVTETGEPDIPEILQTMKMLMVAGNETTRFAFVSGMKVLVEHPDVAKRLGAEPDDIPAFVEETLRLSSPVQTLFRRTTDDVELHGVLIPKGARVEVRFGAANRDPATFSCPTEFTLGRENIGSHLAFGSGIHSCIGMQLARAELAIGFRVILQRMKNFAAARGEDSFTPSSAYLTYGFTELHLKFDPC